MDAREHAVRLSVLKAISEEVKRVDGVARGDAKDAFTPGDRITAALPDGTVVGSVTRTKATPATTAFRVVNAQQFLAWCKANIPTAIVESVRSSDQEAILAGIPKTGVVPDGVDEVEVAAGGGVLQVRPDYEVIKTLDWRPFLGDQVAVPAVESPPVITKTWRALDTEPGYCGVQTVWHGPGSDREHTHLCTKEEHRPNERHTCACGASWLTKEVE